MHTIAHMVRGVGIGEVHRGACRCMTGAQAGWPDDAVRADGWPGVRVVEVRLGAVMWDRVA